MIPPRPNGEEFLITKYEEKIREQKAGMEWIEIDELFVYMQFFGKFIFETHSIDWS